MFVCIIVKVGWYLFSKLANGEMAKIKSSEYFLLLGKSSSEEKKTYGAKKNK